MTGLGLILPLLLEQSIRLCDADGGEIFMPSQDGPQVYMQTGREVPSVTRADGADKPIPRVLIDWLIQRNDILQLSEKEADPRFAIPGTLLARPATLLSFPLRHEQQRIGLLVLWHEGEKRFRQDEIDRLSAVADIGHYVVSSAQLLERRDDALVRRTKELSTLLAATTAFASLESVAELVETLCWNILESVDSTFCRIYLLEQRGEIAIRAACAIRNLSWEPGVGRRFSLESLACHRQVIVGGEPILLTLEDSGHLDELERSLLFGCGNPSALLMPLAVRGHSLGIVGLGEMRSRHKSPYSETKIAMCRAMALQGALALENMRGIESMAQQSDFVSLVSHEIRAPLAKITASAGLLGKLPLDDPVRQHLLDVMNKESAYLGLIVDEVLQSSRLDEGRLDLSCEPLCLGPLIEQIVDMHRSRNSDYDFRTEVPAQALFALGDLVSVQVILENLLQNAVNYSEPGSAITVTLAERGDDVVVGVIDHGVGISHDKLGMVFERYRRLAETGRKVPGVGLGLYIAKKQVEAQQGKIWVVSEPGNGSRFYFSLKRLGEPDGKGFDH